MFSLLCLWILRLLLFLKVEFVVNSFRLFPASFEKPKYRASLDLCSCTAAISGCRAVTLPFGGGSAPRLATVLPWPISLCAVIPGTSDRLGLKSLCMLSSSRVFIQLRITTLSKYSFELSQGRSHCTGFQSVWVRNMWLSP